MAQLKPYSVENAKLIFLKGENEDENESTRLVCDQNI